MARVGGPRKDSVNHGRGMLGGIRLGDGARRLDHEILEIHERGSGRESGR
jgi:hypothetical protein